MAHDDLDEDLLADDGEPPDDPDEAELEELDGDLDEVDLDDEPLDDDEALDDEVLEEDDLLLTSEPPQAVHVAPAREEDEDDDDEDEVDSDDVEASLDVILKERMVVIDDDDDDDDEDGTDSDDRPDTVLRVLPKQPGEFVCQSCFLVKHPSQLADRDAMLCRDCL